MSFRLTRLGATASALAATCLVGALAAGTASAQTEKLRIGWTPTPQNGALQIALDKGFFKKNGLDVTLTQQPAGGSVLYPALGKQYDLVTSQVTDVPKLWASGKKVQFVSGITRYKRTTPGAAPNLMVKTGTVKSYRDLRGKTIATISTTEGLQVTSLKIALQKAGVNVKDIKLVAVPFANQLDQLRAGRVDAALAIPPYINLMKAAGFTGFANTFFSVSGRTPVIAAAYIATQSELKKHPSKFKKYLKAMQETKAWMAKPENLSEWRGIVAQTLRLPAAATQTLTTEELDFAIRSNEVKIWLKPLAKIGYFKLSKIPKNVNSLIWSGALKK